MAVPVGHVALHQRKSRVLLPSFDTPGQSVLCWLAAAWRPSAIEKVPVCTLPRSFSPH